MRAEFDAAGVAVALRDDGIVIFRYGAMPIVDEAQAIATLAAAEKELIRLQVQTPLKTLVHMGQVAKVTREARQYFASSEINGRLSSKVALIASSPTARVIGNFFLGLNRSQRPTRLFDDLDAAVAWLNQD